jgi:hypothetical protein
VRRAVRTVSGLLAAVNFDGDDAQHAHVRPAARCQGRALVPRVHRDVQGCAAPGALVPAVGTQPQPVVPHVDPPTRILRLEPPTATASRLSPIPATLILILASASLRSQRAWTEFVPHRLCMRELKWPFCGRVRNSGLIGHPPVMRSASHFIGRATRPRAGKQRGYAQRVTKVARSSWREIRRKT